MSDIDDKIIERWLSGQNVRKISRSINVPAGRIREIIRAWSAEMMSFGQDERVARQLGRLDFMFEKLAPLIRKGNVAAMVAANKLMNTQNLIQGINQPNAPVVNVEVKPQTSTDRIEAALDALLNDHKKPDGAPPTTH